MKALFAKVVDFFYC